MLLSYGGIALVLQHFLLLFVVQNAQTSWVNPGFVRDSERLHLEKVLDWDKLKPDSLNLLFDTKEMYGACKLQLFGYTESSKRIISKTESPFEILGSSPVTVDKKEGILKVLEMGFECRARLGASSCAKYHMGYFALTCPSNSASFYSPIVPLGWLVHQYYVEQKWETWAHSHCLNWFELEDPAVRSAVRSAACHPLRHYAQASVSEYNYINVPSNLSKYTGFTSKTVSPKLAVEPMQECYLSTVDPSATETKDFHASPVALCCYALPSTLGANSRWSYIFKEVESSDNYMIHGSTSFRAHPFGVETHEGHFYLPGQVPYLSHWYWDLLPYRYCCLWWEGSACAEKYHLARPSPQLRSPAIGYNSAFLLGNLIAKPFETPSKPFMCKDIGEYWLVNSAAFKVQVRTGLVSNYIDKKELLWAKGSSSKSSKSPFVTGLAFQVTSLPHLIFRLLCSDKEYKAYLYVTNTKRGSTTERIDTSSQRFFGHVTISEPSFKETLKTMSFALRHKGEFLGIAVYLVRPEHEFMSVMVSAGANVSATTGLLGNAADAGNAGSSGASAAGGSGLEYSDTCTNNKVADGVTENLFNGKPPDPEPVKPSNSTGSDTADPPAAGVPALARSRRGTSSSTELTISGMGLDKAKEITCLSTNHQKYCTDIEKSSAQIQDRIRRLREGNPNTNPFRYCTRLPPIRGLKARIFNPDTGLGPEDTMMLTCGSPFKASQQGSATCTGSGRIVSYAPSVDITCSMIEDVKKADDKALEWYTVNNRSGQFEQHLEFYHQRRGGKVIAGKKDDKSAGHVMVAHGLVILSTVAAAFCFCITMSRS